MAKYRKIDTRIWNDQKFNRLSNDAKLTFLFALTHQHLTSIGAMRATLAGLASELHWEINRFNASFSEITKQNMIKFDDAASLLWIPNFLKYNKPESPNVVKSWDQLLDYLPECELKNELISHIDSLIQTMSSCFSDALSHAFRKAIPNQEQEHDQEQKQEKEIALNAQDLSEKPVSFYKYQKKVKIQKEYVQRAIEVLQFLNEKANKQYEAVPENIRDIAERLAQGETIEICRSLIVKKARSWLGDVKMDSNLNPVTLFKKENYFRYKGELVIPKDGVVNEYK